MHVPFSDYSGVIAMNRPNHVGAAERSIVRECAIGDG